MIPFNRNGVGKLPNDILSNLIITDIHFVSTMYSEKGAGTKRKDRPRWALVLKYEGETRYYANDREYISDRQHIVVLPKGSNYAWRCTQAGHFCIAEFESDATANEIFSFPVKNFESYLAAMKTMETDRALQKPTCRLDTMRRLYGMLSSLLNTEEQRYAPSAKEQKIRPAVEYIIENYNKRLCNETLAAVCGVSTVYFRKLFKEVMGVSPTAFLQSVRMKKAVGMLQSDYAGITDIAYSLGYNNVYEFSRSFKKWAGVAPSRYAEYLTKGR